MFYLISDRLEFRGNMHIKKFILITVLLFISPMNHAINMGKFGGTLEKSAKKFPNPQQL